MTAKIPPGKYLGKPADGGPPDERHEALSYAEITLGALSRPTLTASCDISLARRIWRSSLMRGWGVMRRFSPRWKCSRKSLPSTVGDLVEICTRSVLVPGIESAESFWLSL